MKLMCIKLDGRTLVVDLDDAIFGLEATCATFCTVWSVGSVTTPSRYPQDARPVGSVYSTKKIYRQKGTGGARHGVPQVRRSSVRW